MRMSLRLGSSDVELITAAGGLLVRNREPLRPYPAALIDRLDDWAEAEPERIFIAERDAAGGWRTVTFTQARQAARAIGAALVARGLSPERPLAVLSENSVDHALLGLGAQYVGVPYAPVSTAYSLVSTDFAKLRDVLAQLTPGLVYVSDGVRYAGALQACVGDDVEVVTSGTRPPQRDATPFAALLASVPGPAVDAARTRVNADTVAKILFTSGSTGSPKGVINTQRMLASNQQMLVQSFPFLADGPPTIVDWLPWNHTFGGNHNLGLVLNNGGTLYVNGGKPASAATFAQTLQNLREIAPTIHFDVPRGFEMLAAALREEPALRKHFFSRLAMMFYAGAGLAPHVWDALHALALETTGARVLITTSLGSTETAPAALTAPWQAEAVGFVGVPMPGVEVKLVPSGEKDELRLRGPNIMPGYWRSETLTRDAFDDEGYYRIGDALKFVDPSDPSRGFVFDGRISEDFKLGTGTWVSVGSVRLRTIEHFAPLFVDVVVSGENREQLAVLAFCDLGHARALATDVAANADAATVLASGVLRQNLAERLWKLAETSTGSATRVTRLVLCVEPPSLDAGEITDKGSLNQRGILRRRAALVEDAHAAEPPPHVVALDRAPA